MVMLFNVTEMKEVLGLEPMVSQAELRLLIRDPRFAPGNDERLELYQGAGDKARYLGSHYITNELNGKWISFDVTKTVKNWLKNPGEYLIFHRISESKNFIKCMMLFLKYKMHYWLIVLCWLQRQKRHYSWSYLMDVGRVTRYLIFQVCDMNIKLSLTVFIY